MMKHFLLYATLALMGFYFSACFNPQKLIYQGQYDYVVDKLTTKFKNNLKRKPTDVQAFEDAFTKATAKDLQDIERIKLENNDANWIRINDIYKKIKGRQERIAPLLPVKDDNGRIANIVFVNVDQQVLESQHKAAEFDYNRGSQLLAEAKQTNDPLKARSAYDAFVKTKQIEANYRDVVKLEAEAKELGMVRIFANLADNANTGLQYTKTQVCDSIYYDFRPDNWTQTDYTPRPNVTYRYDAICVLNRITFSPHKLNPPSTYTRTTTIDSGRTTLTAIVLVNELTQYIEIQGVWQLIDKASNSSLCNHSFTKGYTHSIKYATFTGDKRALTADDIKMTQIPSTPPSNLVLMNTVVGVQIRNEIRNMCAWRKP